MNPRLGIELAPSACRIVEFGGRASGSARETRVRWFAVMPPSGIETRAKFQSLRRRTAAVVVWTLNSEHRQVVVGGGTYEAMRAEALKALEAAGVATQGFVADIAPIVGPPRRGVRQPVVVSLMPAAELSAAVEPLRQAGIRLRSVTTPAVALASMARHRRAFSVPGAIEAWVALERTATCIALVRDAVMVGARTLRWGFEADASSTEPSREHIAARLGDAILEFVADLSGGAYTISQVCVCGGLPELRSMTLPLMERLDVEVEPLDSLFGIDAARLPEPAAEFRERCVELRVAWAAAAWPSPINLLRPQLRHTSRQTLTRAAVAAGVVAGIALGWRVQQSDWWRTTAPTRTVSTTTIGTAGRSERSASRQASGPQGQVAGARRMEAPAVQSRMTPAVAQSKPPFVPPPDSGPTMPAAIAQSRRTSTPPVARTEPAPVARTEPAPVVRTEPPLVRTEPPTAERRPRLQPSQPGVQPSPPSRPSEPQPSRVATSGATPAARPTAPPSAPRVRSAPQEAALPFDAVLGTILFSPDRRLAIIDGRIVGVGDQVRGARITDITTSTVMLRDAQGRLRQLTMGAATR